MRLPQVAYRTHIISIFLAVVLCASPSKSVAKVTETRTQIGKFELVEEISKFAPGETPIFHVASDWTKLHLNHRFSNGGAKVILTDNGGWLEMAIDSPRCLSRGMPYAFSGRNNERPLWVELQKYVKSTLKVCANFTLQERSYYAREFQSAELDWISAVSAMKANAQLRFGGWKRRCTKFSKIGGWSAGPPVECRRYSAKVN